MAEPIIKICTECHHPLPLNMFHKHKAGKYGRDSKCKKCKLSIQAKHRSKPEVKERIRISDADRWANDAEYRDHQKAIKATPEGRIKQRIAVAKHRAKPGVKEALNQKTYVHRQKPEIKEMIRQQYKEYAQRPGIKKRRRLFEQKKRSTIKGNLNNRMSLRIRTALHRGKQGGSWTELVPYSLDKLMFHLEAQFKAGMSWWNRGDWHIDHKRPIASFNFESSNDSDFKECWALENLQPLWAIDNIRKGARL